MSRERQRERKPLVGNASDEEAVEEARRLEREEHRLQRQDMNLLLETPVGRRVVWRILGQCGIFTDGWDPSARIHFNAGKRNVGLWLLDEVMAANDEAFLLMQREAKRKETQDA